MSQSRRSKLLSTTFATVFVLTVSACASVEKLDKQYLPEDPQIVADQAQIAPMMRIANETRSRGDLATAAALYRRAYQIAPTQVDPLLSLGFTLSDAGATVEAAEAFRQALRVDNDNPEAMRGLGLALLQRNQIELALEQLYKALERKEDVRVYNAIGVAHDVNGDQKGAQTYYYLGLELQPTNLSLRTNLGLSLALSRDYERSIDILNAVARDPMATAGHRQTLALAYGLAGDRKMAAQTARIDLEEPAVQEKLRYFEALRSKREEQLSQS